MAASLIIFCASTFYSIIVIRRSAATHSKLITAEQQKMMNEGAYGKNSYWHHCIAITYGLSQGEAVVTREAYLINGGYIFRKGSSTVAGMDM
jgi:hypothetical protein